MKIGKKLEILRKEANLDQETVADKLEVSRALIGHWERDRREPSYDMLDELAKLYNTTVSEIFSSEDNNNYGFLNNIIIAMKNEGKLTKSGYEDCDDIVKQMLILALNNHIKSMFDSLDK